MTRIFATCITPGTRTSVKSGILGNGFFFNGTSPTSCSQEGKTFWPRILSTRALPCFSSMTRMLPVQYAREVLRLPFPNPLQSFERRIVSEPFFSLTGKKAGCFHDLRKLLCRNPQSKRPFARTCAEWGGNRRIKRDFFVFGGILKGKKLLGRP